MSTSGVEFDQATGRLRLTAQRFGELVDGPPSAQRQPELAAAGVPSADGPHPLLLPGLAAVRAPVCTIQMHVAGAAAVHLHHGWVTPEAAAFLLFVREDVYEFVTVGPTFSPAAIAQILRLGPRTLAQPTEPFDTTVDDVDALFAEDTDIRQAAVAERRAGRVVVGWAGPDGESNSRGLIVLDGSEGLFVADPDEAGGAVAWRPVDGSEVWRRIVMLLPGDGELAAPTHG